MVEQRLCSFCGASIEPGTGKMHVKKDGTVYLFCSMKCEKNMVDMKRVPRRVEWTKAYATAKQIHKAEKHLDETPEAAPAEKKA